jgi:DNA primase
MSGRIPQDFIDDLVQRADIVEVVGSRVPLTKAGREYKARCPFHGEKTASFWVSPQKGFYHCFGCGAHGTALGFLMEFERLEFPVAVEELARSVGVEVPRDGTERENLEPIYTLLDKAAQRFRQALRDHPAAVAYLQNRGLDGETAREFGIGYAPDSWDALLSSLGPGDQERKDLLRAGLIVARETGGHYDRFRDRIMFPIRDSRGRTIAFGGRVLATGEPKYLNSPETPVFHKGRELYGLYEARRAERRLERLLVVEGYMDVVMLAAHGIRNAVGTLGTATTPEHLRRLFGLVNEVTFCFDGDRAGRDAAWRALQASLPALHDGRQVSFLLLPDGEDPDSLVRAEGAERFRARMNASVPLSRFLIETLSRDLDVTTPDGRARLAALARPLLAQLPQGVYRDLLTAEVATRVGVPAERLDQHFAGTSTVPQRPADRGASSRARVVNPGAKSARGSLSRQAIALLLHFPAIAREVPLPTGLDHAALAGGGLKGLDLLGEVHAQAAVVQPEAGMAPAVLLERFRDRAEFPHLAGLLAEEPLVDADGAAGELRGCLDRIVQAAMQQELSDLLQKAGHGTLSSAERDRIAALQKQVVAGSPAGTSTSPQGLGQGGR